LEVNPDQPVAGLAKPHHEKFIRLVGADPRSIEANKKNLIEAYNYLGVYYSINKNYDCSKAAFSKTLELDAANKIATTLIADKNLVEATGTCELIPAQ
jgi:hypothetical protein